jgi:capsular exopolysaccharide synthesis family protein
VKEAVAMSSTVLRKAYERWHSPGRVPGRLPESGPTAPAEEIELGALLGIPLEAVEDYAALASRIELALQNEVRRTLVVAGAGRRAGASTVAVGLASTMAATGRSPILLVDGNLRDPILHQKFKVPRQPGLTDLVRGVAKFADVVQLTAVPNLSLVPVGSETKVPQAFFQQPAFREVLDAWAREYSCVIFDSAPFGGVADPASLAQAVSGTILVMEAGRTVREVAAETTEELRRTGIRVLGAVLNRRRFYVPDWIYRRV